MENVVRGDLNREETEYPDSISSADYDQLARRCAYHKGGHHHYKKLYASARKYIRALILATAFLFFLNITQLILIAL